MQWSNNNPTGQRTWNSSDWWANNNGILVFAGNGSGNVTNNYADWSFNVNAIIFNSGAAAFTNSGGALGLTNTNGVIPKIENNSANTQTISFNNIALRNISEFNAINGDLVFNSGNIFVDADLRFWGDNGKTNWMNTVIANGNAASTLAIQQNSTVVFQKTNTYSGQTYIHAGQLIISNGARAGTGNINLGGTNLAGSSLTNALYLGMASSTGGVTNTNAININGGGGASSLGGNNTSGINEFSGPITLSQGVTFRQASGGTLIMSGAISGASQSVTNAGAGTTIFTGNNSFGSTSGGLVVSAGTVRATSSANALGQGTLTLSGGGLSLGNDTGLSFNRNTTVSANTTITSDRTSSGAGVTHTLGTLSIGAQTLILASGANVSSGTAGLTFGAATLTGAATFTANSGTLLTLASVTGTQNMTINGAGNMTISGVVGTSTGTLSKSGNGTLILSGNNTYSGTTTLSAGTLRGGNDNALGTGGLSLNGGTIASDGGTARVFTNSVTMGGANVTFGDATGTGALTFSNVNLNQDARSLTVGNNTTIAGVISNGGGTAASLTKLGSGTLTLSGANTYSGGTLISAGTLRLGAGADTGSFGTGNITNNSTFLIDRTGSLTVDNAISGTGALNKTGAGTLSLGGNSSYGGATAISNGAVRISHANALGTTAAGTTVSTGAALELSGGITTAAEALSLSGTGISTAGALRNISGNNTYAGTITLGAATRINSDSGTLTLDVASGNAIIGTQNLTFGGAGNIAVNDAMNISTGTLTKDGAGTLTIAGTQSYTGATTVSAGTLAVTGTSTGSAVTVNTGGTLSGSGSLGALTIASGGTLSPGSSPGVLSVGNLTWEGGGNYNWQVYDAAGAAGTGYDTISGNSLNITATEGTKFNINLWSLSGIGPDTNGSAINFTNTNSYAWTLGSFTNGITNFVANKFSINTAATNGAGGFANTYAGIFSLYTTNAGNDLILAYTAPAGVYDVTVNSGSANQDAATGGTNLFTGALALNKLGAGTLVMTNPLNDYTGVTTINEGTLQINVNAPSGSAGALGNAITAVLVGNSSTNLAAGFNIGVANVTNSRGLTVVAGTGAADRIIGTTIASGTAEQAGGIIFNTNATLNAASGGTMLYSGALTGSGNLTISNNGTSVFSGANTYTGTTTVLNGSTLRIANNNALGGTGSGTTVNSGGTLATSNGITSSEGLTISGTGVGSGGAVRNVSGDNTLSGGITLGAASRINSDTGLLTLSGGMNGANFGLTIGGAGNTTVSGNITNSSGVLTKDGNGTVTLTGANTYSGGTLVSAGSLVGSTTSLQGTITNNGLVIFDQSADGTYSSVLGGTGALVKTNAGALTLSGANTQSGGTTIGQGTLSIGSGGATGSLAGAITNNATLLYNRTGELTQGTVISGTGALNKAGSGTLTLSQANTYTGATTISNGAIRISNATGLGTTAAGTTVVSGAALELTGDITVGAESLALNGSGISSGGALRSISGNNTYGGTITMGSSSTIASDADTLTISGGIGGNHTLTVLGAGNVTLNGIYSSLAGGGLVVGTTGTLTLNAANTFSGNMSISNGATVIAANNAALGTTASATSLESGATLAFSNNINSAENVTIAGTGVGGLGALRNLSGANTNTGTITAGANATISTETGTSLQLNNIALTGAANRSVTFSGAGTSLITGNVSTFAGSLTNNIIKDGTGSLIISNSGSTGTGQLNLINGSVTIAAGSLTTSTNTGTRAIDLGTGPGGDSANNVAFYANSGITVSNSFYIAPNPNSALRTVGSESTTGTITYNNQFFLGGNVRLTSAGTANVVFSGNISNTGTHSVTKIGAGTVTLSGANTYGGTAVVEEGTLALSGGSALANTVGVTVNGGTLAVNSTEAIGTLSGSGGSVALNAGLVTGVNATSTSFSGVFTGTNSLSKNAAGTLTLSGNSTGYSGEVILNEGVLLAGNAGAFGTGTVTINFDGGAGTRTLASSSSTGYTLNNNFNLYYNAFTLGQTEGGTGSLTLGGSGKTFFLGDDGGVNTRIVTVNGSHTIAAQMTGQNTFAKAGAGSLTLSGANTSSGALQLREGTILIGNNAALGTGTFQIQFDEAGAKSIASSSGTAYTLNNAVNIYNDFTIGQSSGGTGSLTFGGAVQLGNEAGMRSITTATGTGHIFSGAISGLRGITKLGDGTLTLSGSNAYSGNTLISAGALQIGNGGTTGFITNNITNNASLIFNRSDNSTAANTISGNGSLTKTGAGTLTLSGSSSYTGTTSINQGGLSVSAANNLGGNPGAATTNQLTLNGGTLAVATGFTANANAGMTIGASGGTVNVSTNQNFSQVGGLYGNGAFTKTGTGSMTLGTSAGSYGGTATIGGGTLVANTALGSATVIISNTGTLMGTGTLGAVTVQNGGTIAPGNSPGNLLVSELTLNGGGSYQWEMTNATGSAGVGWDVITVSGGGGTINLNATTGSKFTINVIGTNPSNFTATSSYTWDIIDAGTWNSAFDASAFAINTNSFTATGTLGSWSVANNAGNLQLVYTGAASDCTVDVPSGSADQGAATGGTNQFTGSVGVIKIGAGTLVMTNGANDYTGTTVVQAGTLQINVNAPSGSAGALGNATSAVAIGDSTNAVAAGFNIGVADVTNSRNLTVVAGTGAADRVIGTTITSGTAEQAGNIDLATNAVLNAASGGTMLYSGVLSNSGNVTISNSGTSIFSGANTYSGTTTILSGSTLRIANNSALGVTNGGTTVNSGGTLALSNGISTAENLSIAGTGVGGNGALRNISGANTNTGTVTLSANATVKAESGTRLSLNNVDITGAVNRSVTFDGAGTNLVTGSISTAGGSLTNRIIKSGIGELIISNNGTTGTGQLRLAEGTFILAAGSLTTSTNTGTRAIDIGLSGDATGTNTAANASFLARVATVSNSIYIAPSGGDGSFTRTIGTDSTSGTVTYNSQMYLGHNVHITSAGTANVVYSGNITNDGTLNVTKIGAGSLTLSANNTWRGGLIAGEGTTILSGGNAVWDTNAVTVSSNATLVLGASETIGSLAGEGTVTLGVNSLVTGSNSSSTTYSGAIGGNGGIFKNGTGTFTLAGANTYSGDTIVNSGTLAFSNGSVNSSIIRLGPDNSAGNTTILLSDSDGGTTVSSTLVVQADAGSTRTLASSNATGTNTYGGSIYLDGTGTIAQQAAGVFALTGTEIDVKSRTLTLSSVTNGNIAVSATILDSDANTGNIAKTGNGTVTLSGANAYAGTTLISAGTLQVGNGGATGQLGGGNLTNNASLVVNRTGAISIGNSISGTGSLTKLAAGTLTLSASNSFQGGSTLSAGVLRAANANALGTGALVASEGTTFELTNGITVTNNMSVYTVKFLDGGNVLSGTITNNNTVYDVPSGTTNTLSGYVTGAGGVELIGGGVLSITGTTNDYTGNSAITNGTLRISTLANSNTVSSIGVSNNVTLAGANATNAVFDYTGGNVATDRTFVMSDGGGTINMTNSTTEMTLNGSASGSGKLIVGEGTLILSNGSTANSFAPGSIQVDSGATLQLAADNQIGNTTGLILNGGTFRIGTATTGFSETLGALTLSASSTIDLGAWSTGVRQLTFANSSAITWTGTLTITNWQGVANTSSDVAEILFGTGGLTSGQLGQVYWANQNINGGTLIGGELVPVPEPRVYAAAVALFTVVGWRERKRLREMLTKGLAKKSATPKA